MSHGDDVQNCVAKTGNRDKEYFMTTNNLGKNTNKL